MKAVSQGWTFRDLPLLLSALIAVLRFRLLLNFVSLRRLRARIEQSPLTTPSPSVDVMRVGRAVVSCAHRIPKANCLPRALATQWMLRRRGIESQFCLGATRDASGAFTAHAWITSDGKIVVGDLAEEMNFTLLRPQSPPQSVSTSGHAPTASV